MHWGHPFVYGKAVLLCWNEGCGAWNYASLYEHGVRDMLHTCLTVPKGQVIVLRARFRSVPFRKKGTER